MNRSRLTLLASSLSLLAGGLQAQITKVLPAAAAKSEASTQSVYPFGYTNPRCQQIWQGAAISSGTALVNGIRYRFNGTNTRAEAARSYTKVSFAVGSTTRSPATMTTNFASNITSTMTTVISGNYSLPAQAKPTSAPTPFNIQFNWTVPYIFDATKGNLLLDITLPGTVGKSSYFVDAEYSQASSGGKVTSFGSGGKFSQPELAQLRGDATVLTPGGSIDLTCGNFSKAYTGNLIVGASDKSWAGVPLPLDLKVIQAPGNQLYASLDAMLPFSTSFSLGHRSSFKAAIPNNPSYAGIRFFAQAYYLDAAANGAGLVVTNALDLTVAGGASSGPLTNQVGHYDSVRATGNFAFGANRPGGPVTQFYGVFP